MIEMLLSIAASVVIFVAAVFRLNLLKCSRLTLSLAALLEVLGLAGLMGGCAGAIGEWFLPNADFHAETIIVASVAMICVGISRGRLCQIAARLYGWDGCERRGGQS